MKSWNHSDFLCERLQQAFSINHFPVQSSSISPETQLHCKFPKGKRSMFMLPLCDTRWGERGTGVCGLRAHPIAACTEDTDKKSPIPSTALIWWILMVRTVDSGRKQNWAAVQECCWRESLRRRKVLESSSTSPVAVPSCWGSCWSWAACGVCLGDGAGALCTDTGQWSKWEMGWKQKKKKKKIKKERNFGKFLLTRTQYPKLPGASMGVPTHDKGHVERPHMQRQVRTWGPPPRICLSVYPKTRICLFYYFTTFTNSSDINGGLSLITFLWRKSTWSSS